GVPAYLPAKRRRDARGLRGAPHCIDFSEALASASFYGIMQKLFQEKALAFRLVRRKLMGCKNMFSHFRALSLCAQGFLLQHELAQAREEGGERDSSSGAEAQR
ncbi:MAG: hypothetical protein ACLUCU_09915, partial [Slackia sp.]